MLLGIKAVFCKEDAVQDKPYGYGQYLQRGYP